VADQYDKLFLWVCNYLLGSTEKTMFVIFHQISVVDGILIIKLEHQHVAALTFSKSTLVCLHAYSFIGSYTHFKILHIESLEKIQKIPTLLQRGTVATWVVFMVATGLSWPVSTMTILS
jgi:hypothetical protein